MRKRQKAREREVPQRKEDTDSNDEAVCPKCGLQYPGFWICCDGCDQWFDIKCTTIKSTKHIPDEYYCEQCSI